MASTFQVRGDISRNNQSFAGLDIEDETARLAANCLYGVGQHRRCLHAARFEPGRQGFRTADCRTRRNGQWGRSKAKGNGIKLRETLFLAGTVRCAVRTAWWRHNVWHDSHVTHDLFPPCNTGGNITERCPLKFEYQAGDDAPMQVRARSFVNRERQNQFQAAVGSNRWF